MKIAVLFASIVAFALAGCGEGDPISTPIGKIPIANETATRISLKAIVTAEEQYIQQEGGEALRQYWTHDVSGLYRKLGPSGKEIALLPIDIAKADAAPLGAEEGLGKPVAAKPDPKSGYLFKVVALDADGAPFQGRTFAFCAIPAAYGKTGVRTFLIDHEGNVYQKETGGKPVDQWPKDLAGSGWTTK